MQSFIKLLSKDVGFEFILSPILKILEYLHSEQDDRVSATSQVKRVEWHEFASS